MKYLIKPLTKKMFNHLQRGRSIELSATDRNICNTDDFKGSLTGLYRRGYVNTKMVNIDRKEILSVFITPAGISFLNRHEADEKNREMCTIIID